MISNALYILVEIFHFFLLKTYSKTYSKNVFLFVYWYHILPATISINIINSCVHCIYTMTELNANDYRLIQSNLTVLRRFVHTAHLSISFSEKHSLKGRRRGAPPSYRLYVVHLTYSACCCSALCHSFSIGWPKKATL